MEQEVQLHQEPEVPANAEERTTGERQASSPNQAGENSQTPNTILLKQPIFIGSVDPNIVLTIQQFLFTPATHIDFSKISPLSKEEYELSVLSRPVYDALARQYQYGQMAEEEQARINAVQANEELKQRALMLALQIEHRVRYHRVEKDSPGLKHRVWYYNTYPECLFQFNEKQLKTILTQTRTLAQKTNAKEVVIKSEDVWNTMDFLLMFGYLTAVNAPDENITTPRERVVYKLTISAEQRLQVLERSAEQQKQLLQQKQEELNKTYERISELKLQIQQAKTAN